MVKEVPGGYNGKVLRVDLTTGRLVAEPIDDLFCRRYIGGVGFVTYYLWKELKPGIDALSPENKLVFALGPISGIQLPGAARDCVGAKSPLTGTIGYAEAAGFWAAELKRAGYDAIIIEGKAARPVYLWVRDGRAGLSDASHLWGRETKETSEAVRTELGDERVQLALIGPAGEKMVRYACIMHGLHDTAGRCGLGAVMGSKNLKAVAVRGDKMPKVVDRGRIKQIRQQALAHPHPLSLYGTGGPEMFRFEQSGDLPVRNFRDGLFPEVEKINAIVIKETIRTGMEGCFACPIRCKKVVQFEGPYCVDPAYGGPEYETLAALGSNCGIDNLKAICKGSERCNAYAIDTISTGGVIAFAMECFEKGLLTVKDTGGVELRFGNADAMLKFIEMIARRQGIGDLMAEGTARMARKIGHGAEKLAVQTRGLETTMHEPRMKVGSALGQMIGVGFTDDFFANERMIEEWHPLGILTPVPIEDIGPRKVGLLKTVQCAEIITDALVLCKFLHYSPETVVELLKAVTGWDTGLVEMLRVGERLITVARLFAVREGFNAADDILPERFFHPKTDGALSSTSLIRDKMERAKKFYYTLMGWDAQGVPLPEKVEELEIV